MVKVYFSSALLGGAQSLGLLLVRSFEEEPSSWPPAPTSPDLGPEELGPNSDSLCSVGSSIPAFVCLF